MKRSIGFLGLGLLSLAILIGACSKETNTEPSKVNAFMVDAPGDYQAVWIEVLDVRYHTKGGDENDSSSSWQSLEDFTPETFNLLDLVAGNEAFLGSFETTEERIGQIRLVLGENNTVMVDSISHPLDIPSGSESGLKIIINEKLEPGETYNLILDFDVDRSITLTGNNEYKLRPTIKTYFESESGSIAGVVLPAELEATIYAIQGNDSNSTFTNGQGEFLFNSLDPGNYEVHVKPADANNYPPQVIQNVEVVKNITTVLDTINY